MTQPLSYYLHSPELENLVGSEFGKIKGTYWGIDNHHLREILTYTSLSLFSHGGGTRHHLKFCPNACQIRVLIQRMNDREKIALVRAISAHL